MTAPTASVVMAAYNGAALIGATLDSLAAQTFTDFEIVVVDDCSTDGTRDLLAAWPDPRLRVIHAPSNGGPVRARNLAVANARGRYLAALDQDDLCRSERLERQIAYLDAHPGTVALGTAAAILERGRVRSVSAAPSVTTPASLAWLLHIDNPLIWSSLMIRADAARALDPFTRPDLLYAEDFDLYHRLLALGTVARLDEELLVYRRHDAGASARFVDTMTGSGSRVLAAAYAPALGELAVDCAALIVRHIMGGIAAPDRATLAKLGSILRVLQDDFLARYDCDAESRKLIRWETARRWARVTRASLRSGSVTLTDAMLTRPEHLGLGHAGLDDLLMSRLVGAARSLRL